MFFCGLVAGIYYETHETSIGAMPTRERGEIFVYTINYIVINHLNHFNIHAVVCTFHLSIEICLLPVSPRLADSRPGGIVHSSLPYLGDKKPNKPVTTLYILFFEGTSLTCICVFSG